MYPGRRCGAQTGFSLVEIAVALAILGLAMLSALPFLQGWKDAIDLRGSAVRVGDSMLAARMRSVVERRDFTLSVDYGADTWSLAPPLETARNPGSVDLYLDDTDPDCPSLSSGNVVFRPNGTADAAGFEAVYLKSRRNKVQLRYRVKILGATGRVSVEKWAGGEWVGAN